MNRRHIDRNLLASFLEYASNGVISPIEWNRFAVNHYADPTMERARVECVRILQKDGGHLSASHKEALIALAKELRDAI